MFISLFFYVNKFYPNKPNEILLLYSYFHILVSGENDTFLQLQKVSQKNYVVPSSHSSLVDKNLVQFQVAAINIIGESPPCFPLCIRLVKTRKLDD